ncbi:MAG: hypothetical protein AAFV90_10400 [Cyanobacteria bacterium J06634_5]
MTDTSETTATTETTPVSDMTDLEAMSPLQNFFVGAALGGFVSAVFLLFFLEFSAVSITQIGVAKPAIALIVSLLCGLLTAKFKGNFFNALTDTLSNLGT